MSRKGLIIIIITALVLAIGITVVFTYQLSRDSGKPQQQQETDTAQGETLSPAEQAHLEELMQEVSGVRELAQKKKLKSLRMNEKDLQKKLHEDLEEEYSQEEEEADEKILKALGLMAENLDLRSVILGVYTEQVEGFYDVDEKEIVLVNRGGQSSDMEDFVLSHELTHALQDQNFVLDKPPLEEENYTGNKELAVESLIEGDATVAMMYYALEYLDLDKILTESFKGVGTESEALEAAPAYIQESLLFPYEEGANFVMELFFSSGWEGVDRAYSSPPLSSEQIIHPEKYMDAPDPPREVTLGDMSQTLGSGWNLLDEEVLGEFDLRVLFKEYGEDDTAEEAAAGWGGNLTQYYEGPEGKYVLVMKTNWDSPEDAGEFFDHYKKYMKERFGTSAAILESSPGHVLWQVPDHLYLLSLNGSDTSVIVAPSSEILERIRPKVLSGLLTLSWPPLQVPALHR